MNNKPIRTNHDKEEYFSARFRCPHCGTNLGSYSYGRLWCDGQMEEFIADTHNKCAVCRNELDWSELRQESEE